ncbi:hypothetical protein JA9_000338 [Meyerozyma sp. JA9]|nr:hypothetical protein JA9_000338 [Meyerozyma sp. JA9]
MVCPNKQWSLQYDEILGQYYYINTQDNSMSFDLPCEVHYTPDQRKAKNLLGHFRKKSASDPCVRTTSVASSASSASRKRSILSRIGSALSRSSQSSPSPSSQSSQSLQSSKSQSEQVSSQQPTYTQTSASESSDFTTENFAAMGGFEDEYLLYNPSNLRNFAGTSGGYNSEEEQSISSESVNTYYSELDNNDFYYDYPESIFSESGPVDYDKEKEREELRLQFMNELEI